MKNIAEHTIDPGSKLAALLDLLGLDMKDIPVEQLKRIHAEFHITGTREQTYGGGDYRPEGTSRQMEKIVNRAQDLCQEMDEFGMPQRDGRDEYGPDSALGGLQLALHRAGFQSAASDIGNKLVAEMDKLDRIHVGAVVIPELSQENSLYAIVKINGSQDEMDDDTEIDVIALDPDSSAFGAEIIHLRVKNVIFEHASTPRCGIHVYPTSSGLWGFECAPNNYIHSDGASFISGTGFSAARAAWGEALAQIEAMIPRQADELIAAIQKRNEAQVPAPK